MENGQRKIDKPIDTDRLLNRIDAVVVAVIALAVALAYLIPVDYLAESSLRHAVNGFVFMTRTFLPHLGIALLVMAMFAMPRRAWKLVAAECIVALFLLTPSLVLYLPGEPPVVSEPRVKVVSANLLSANPSTKQAIDTLLAHDADLLLLQEYTPAMHQQFGGMLMRQYPHHFVEPREGNFGMAAFSRTPLGGQVITEPPLGHPDRPQMRLSFLLNDRRVSLYHVHLLYQWRRDGMRQFAGLMNQVAREVGPVMLVGDFNMTNTSPQGDVLMRAGFRDGLDLAADGLMTTWPRRGWLTYVAWPSFRLDHLYLSPNLLPADIATAETPGSDHDHITATIGFAPVPPHARSNE